MVGLKGVPFPAGIENFTEQIGRRLVDRGHQVTVYVRPYVNVGREHRGMRIRRLPSIATKHLDALSHTFLASLDVLFREVDVVHYHALGPSVFALLPRLRGLKTVVHVHGLDWQRAKWSAFASRCLRAAEYSAVYFPHRTVAISMAVKQYLEEKFDRPIDYVPTGVEMYEYAPPAEIARWGLEKDSYILFLSRLVPEKGCHYLIQAYERLQTDKRLVIAGPAPAGDAYAARLQQTTNPNVVFTGAVTGRLLDELFSNAYIYVLPSEIEGLPHALLQALSHGRCVLASDIEGNLEAMGDAGMTFRSRDPLDLQHKLECLLANPAVVHAAADGARARVRQRYCWESVVDGLEAIYASCLESGPLPAASPAGR